MLSLQQFLRTFGYVGCDEIAVFYRLGRWEWQPLSYVFTHEEVTLCRMDFAYGHYRPVIIERLNADEVAA